MAGKLVEDEVSGHTQGGLGSSTMVNELVSHSDGEKSHVCPEALVPGVMQS